MQTPTITVLEGASQDGGATVEARLTWEGELVAVAHEALGRTDLRLGDFRFGVSLPTAIDPALRVARKDLALTEATAGGGDVSLLTPDGDVLAPGQGLRIAVAALAIELRRVRPAEALPRARRERRLAGGVFAGALLHGVLLALAALGEAPIGDRELAHRAVLEGYLASIADRSDPAPPVAEGPTEIAAGEDARFAAAPGGSAAAAVKREGAAAGAALQRGGGGPSDEASVATFGMIALLGGAGDAIGPAFGADLAAGGATAALFDGWGGSGGIELSGTGLGGGGLGAGVGHTGRGLAMLDGVGRGARGPRLGGHVTKSPFLRCGSPPEAPSGSGCTTQIVGRLPPETVQRIVRQSFGRFRQCYEAGLVKNPNLEGRIDVKFVIDREGAVSVASVANRTIQDESVAACVVRAYQAISFPKPEGGVVTVVYPLVLSVT